MTIAFTICSNNYLAQALALGDSLMKFNPEFTFKIGLVDKRSHLINYSKIPFEVIEAEKSVNEKWPKMVMRYNIQELNTAVKPFFFNYFFDNEISCNRIIYLDPDIQVFSSFSELEKEFSTSDIILTPHITKPIYDDKKPAENDFLNTGIFNLGFIGIKNTVNSRNMLDWWKERLINKGFNDVKSGLFTDQIWINFVPVFFDKVKVFKHPGYNMGYWNLGERTISLRENIYNVNDDFHLIFFHFSGYSILSPEIISRYQNRFNFVNRPDLHSIFNGYRDLLTVHDYNFYSSIKCYYSELKEKYDDEVVLKRVKQIPIFKRALRKFINYLIKRFDVILDYNVFYDRENLEKSYSEEKS